jgi:hypothetical protein
MTFVFIPENNALNLHIIRVLVQIVPFWCKKHSGIGGWLNGIRRMHEFFAWKGFKALVYNARLFFTLPTLPNPGLIYV